MADISESEPIEEPAAALEEAPHEPTAEEARNFTFWVVALPFVLGSFYFASQYFTSANPTMTQLINAGGCLIMGLFFGAVVNAFAADQKPNEAAETENPHENPAS